MTTDTFAKSAHPGPATAIAWCGKDGIYVEYPVKGGGPNYVTRFPKTTEGLITALNILIENPIREDRTLTTKEHPLVKRPAVQVTDATRAAAAEIVKRMLK